MSCRTSGEYTTSCLAPQEGTRLWSRRPPPPGPLLGFPVGVEPIVQGLQADAQDVVRFTLVAAVGIQGGHDQPPLDFLDGGAHLEVEAADTAEVAAHLPRQTARRNLVVGHHEGPVGDVLELAD